MRKYLNVPTICKGQRFDSKKEAERYIELLALERAGKIASLEVHPRFTLIPTLRRHGKTIRKRHYTADFAYMLIDGPDTRKIVEDVKSPRTRRLDGYQLRAALFQWLYPEIEFREK